MSNLEQYLFKNIEAESKYGIKYAGYVDMYNSADDNDEQEESIGIIPDENAKEGVELYASDILSIKVKE